jgi:hypothetical protein
MLWDEHPWSDDEQERRRFRNGEDVHYLPLIDRKLRLRRVVPKRGERLLYCDHIYGDGEGLFRLACENDLEGIVAKRKSDPYLLEYANWLKVRNSSYSQWVGREELFERERGADLDAHGWDACVIACAEATPPHFREQRSRQAATFNASASTSARGRRACRTSSLRR